MEKFATLEPVRLHGAGSRQSGRNLQPRLGSSLVGRLPSDLHILILSHLPIPDFPAYSLCSRSNAALAQDEGLWERRWKALQIDRYGFTSVIDRLENYEKDKAAAIRAAAPPTISADDEFGDFATPDVLLASADEMGDFVGSPSFAPPRPKPPPFPSLSKRVTSLSRYIKVHKLLRPLTLILSNPPHVILSELGAYSGSSLREEASLLHLLSLYLSSTIQPVRRWKSLYVSLRSAMDRFDANLLTAFDVADGKSNEAGMRAAAESSWEIWDNTGDWEMGKMWAEKREIFYEQGKWDPLDNLTKDAHLNFDAMDEFMSAILASIIEDGSRAVRVFPPESRVLLAFAEKVATEVIGEYITSLLVRARELSRGVYLTANAATFREAWRLVDAIMEAASARQDSNVTRTQAEDIVYQMFEINMDEYLDDEIDAVKQQFDNICAAWDRQTEADLKNTESAQFLRSSNPAQVKRTVLASFTNALLLPVTIVPRAVGGVLVTGTNAAAQGIAMLNPQRWGGSTKTASNGYRIHSEDDSDMVFEVGPEEDGNSSPNKGPSEVLSPPVSGLDSAMNKLDLLLSLDVALELIQTNRESLKRVEIFAGYPGHYGHRVRDTIEELFILALQYISDRHIVPGFTHAIERMKSYKPAEHQETTSVAPLLHFFELVHIGDTIQSMVQVYFDKELAPHIDKTDFLNAVVREKKRFENVLDDSVASGLNTGTDVLMNQVEHIILTLTKPREYYPPENAPLELGPTKGCTEAIKCLEMHCKLLKGSTSKEVLEVFYQEVGIRLIAILQKHIKRQIISLNGGFQVIADLNAYYTFISSLKVAPITAELSYLKMLGHVYVVEDAKDLAQIVRDVARYGGAYRPEDIYEFIQRRSDWKKIEKTVDKTMYNLSFKEDCIIA